MIINPIESALKRLVKSSETTAPAKVEATITPASQKRSIADQLQVQFRAQQFSQANMALVVPSNADVLIELVKQGRIVPGEHVALTLGNVTEDVQLKAGKAAVVLTEKSRKDLALGKGAAQLDSSLSLIRPQASGSTSNSSGLNFGEQVALYDSVDLKSRDIKFVLVDEQDYPNLIKKYGEAVERHEAPAKIAGKPYTEFFRSSDDLHNDLEVDAFQRAVPGFAQRSTVEQKSVAAMASRAAISFPADIDMDIRRRLAAALVSFRSVESATSGELSGQLRTFYHGLSNKGSVEQVVREGFRVGPNGSYGSGIYYGSPTVGSGYAFGFNLSEPADMLSGEVAVGKVTTRVLEDAREADTRFIFRPYSEGDYWVTKDPSRFRIKSITSYRPEHKGGLEKLIPDLMLASLKNPEWASTYLARIEPARLSRSLEHYLNVGNRVERLAAGTALAQRGDFRGFLALTDAIGNGATPELRVHSALTLARLKGLSPEQERALASQLKAADPEVRHAVALDRIAEDSRYFPDALEALHKGDTAAVRAEAAVALARAKGLDATQTRAVQNAFASAEPNVRHAVGIELVKEDERYLSYALEAIKNGKTGDIQKRAFSTTFTMPNLTSKQKEEILDSLAFSLPEARQEVGLSLLKKEPRLFPYTLDALQNGKDPIVRMRAADAIVNARRGLSLRQQDGLLEALASCDAEMRHMLGENFLQLDPRFFSYALEAFQHSKNLPTRFHALESFTKASGLTEEQQQVFMKALAVSDAQIRHGAGARFGALDARFVPYALDAIQNGDVEAQKLAVRSLASSALLSHDQETAFLSLLEGATPSVRDEVVRAANRNPKVFSFALSALENGSTSETRLEAARYLAGTEGLPRDQHQVILQSLSTAAPEVRFEGGISGLKRNDLRYYPLVLDALRNGAAQVKTEAAETLLKAQGLIESQQAEVMAALDMSEAFVRHRVGVPQLGKDLRMFPYVLDALQNGFDSIRMYAAASLASVLEHVSPRQRQAAIDALIRFDSSQYGHLKP